MPATSFADLPFNVVVSLLLIVIPVWLLACRSLLISAVAQIECGAPVFAVLPLEPLLLYTIHVAPTLAQFKSAYGRYYYTILHKLQNTNVNEVKYDVFVRAALRVAVLVPWRPRLIQPVAWCFAKLGALLNPGYGLNPEWLKWLKDQGLLQQTEFAGVSMICSMSPGGVMRGILSNVTSGATVMISGFGIHLMVCFPEHHYTIPMLGHGIVQGLEAQGQEFKDLVAKDAKMTYLYNNLVKNALAARTVTVSDGITSALPYGEVFSGRTNNHSRRSFMEKDLFDLCARAKDLGYTMKPVNIVSHTVDYSMFNRGVDANNAHMPIPGATLNTNFGALRDQSTSTNTDANAGASANPLPLIRRELDRELGR